MNSDWSFGHLLETENKIWSPTVVHQLLVGGWFGGDNTEELQPIGEWVQSSCGIKKVFHTQWKQDNVNKNAREWLGPRNKNRTFTAFMVENHITTSHTNVIIEILYPCSTKLILINYTCERKTWHKVVPFINIYLQGFIWQG